MESLLHGIPGLCIHLDDILVMGRITEEHFAHLAEVLHQLKEVGMRPKEEKRVYLLHSVEYWAMSSLTRVYAQLTLKWKWQYEHRHQDTS